jgi:hypothetical protein
MTLSKCKKMHPIITGERAEIQGVDIGVLIFHRHDAKIRRWPLLV